MHEEGGAQARGGRTGTDQQLSAVLHARVATLELVLAAGPSSRAALH